MREEQSLCRQFAPTSFRRTSEKIVEPVDVEKSAHVEKNSRTIIQI